MLIVEDFQAGIEMQYQYKTERNLMKRKQKPDGRVLSGWTGTAETTTFIDCAGCLLTFSNSRFNSDDSLNAIAFLHFCAVRLVDGRLVGNKKSSVDGSSGVLSNGVSDVQELTDNGSWTSILTHILE